MFGQQNQGNPPIQTRDYSQGSSDPTDKGMNSEKKGGRYPEYVSMMQQVAPGMPYGGIPDAMAGAAAFGYYPPSYAFPPMYDGRRMYSQMQASYLPQGGPENQVNPPRSAMNPNQAFDMKRYVAQDQGMSHMNYIQQYSAQPQIQMYAPVMAAQQYQANALMMQQQGYRPYGVNPQSLKREAPSNPLASQPDKNGKKVAVNSPPFVINRMTNPMYPGMPQYQAATAQYIQPQSAPMPKEPLRPPQHLPSYQSLVQKTEPAMSKATDPKPVEKKPAITEIERTVASILCSMKGGAVQSVQPTSTASSMPSMQPVQPVQPVQPMQPMQPMPSMQPVQPVQPFQPAQPAMPKPEPAPMLVPQMTTAQASLLSQPQPQPSEVAPAGESAGAQLSVVPSLKTPINVNRSGGVPPIPSPPPSVIATTLKTMVCNTHPVKEEGVKPVETNPVIIPPLNPEQLMLSRRHIQIREKPQEPVVAPAEASVPESAGVAPSAVGVSESVVGVSESVVGVSASVVGVSASAVKGVSAGPATSASPSGEANASADAAMNASTDAADAAINTATNASSNPVETTNNPVMDASSNATAESHVTEAKEAGVTPIVPTKSEDVEEIPLMRVPSGDGQEELNTPIIPAEEKESDEEEKE